LWIGFQGNEERWRSEGDGTESSNRQLAAVSNLTQVIVLPGCSLYNSHF